MREELQSPQCARQEEVQWADTQDDLADHLDPNELDRFSQLRSSTRHMSNDATTPGPDGVFVSYRSQVGQEWIDVNEHMNTSRYDQVFDAAEKRLFDEFGMDEDHIQRTGLTIFRLEKLVEYRRETMLNDMIEVRSRVVWTDFRRIHHLHEMWNLTRNHRSAFADCISIHVDLHVRRSIEIVDNGLRAKLTRFLEANEGLPPPSGVPQRVLGRRIAR